MSRDSGVFVTDTHPLAYYAGRRFSKLSKRARGLFDGAGEGSILICIPTIVLAEITILLQVERVRLSVPFDRWCRDLEADAGFSIEPLLWTGVAEMRHLPFKDPFDRMIVV